MTSDHAYVWTWLPKATEPVPAGRVDQVGNELRFSYAQSYLARDDAISLQPNGLPLQRGQQRPDVGHDAAGAIRDAAPDSWGMQVLLRRLVGTGAVDTNDLPLITYLTESGSNRVGALDFQASPHTFAERPTHGTLAEVLEAGERLAQGLPFSPEVDDVLTWGTAIGGARPKAILVATTGGPPRQLIAKFSVSTDLFPWIQAEAVGMELARRCGVQVPATELIRTNGRDVLLIERFDRGPNGRRRHVLSGLTMLGIHEMAFRHTSYTGLVELIRLKFTDPTATLRELYTRILINVLLGNTDDHARNIAAFWDGRHLELTPAYDLCPQPRSTGEASQAMAFGPDGDARSRIASVLDAAPLYRLSPAEAASVNERCLETVRTSFDEVCEGLDVAGITRELLWERSILNPSIFYPTD